MIKVGEKIKLPKCELDIVKTVCAQRDLDCKNVVAIVTSVTKGEISADVHVNGKFVGYISMSPELLQEPYCQANDDGRDSETDTKTPDTVTENADAAKANQITLMKCKLRNGVDVVRPPLEMKYIVMPDVLNGSDNVDILMRCTCSREAFNEMFSYQYRKWTEWDVIQGAPFAKYRTDNVKRVQVLAMGIKTTATCHRCGKFDLMVGINVAMKRLYDVLTHRSGCVTEYLHTHVNEQPIEKTE